MSYKKTTTTEYEVEADQTKMVFAREPDGNVSFSVMPKKSVRNAAGHLLENYAPVRLSLSLDEVTSLIEALTAVLRDEP